MKGRPIYLRIQTLKMEVIINQGYACERPLFLQVYINIPFKIWEKCITLVVSLGEADLQRKKSFNLKIALENDAPFFL